MPKGEYTRTEAGRRAYFVVTGIELPNTITHYEIKAHAHALPEDQWRRYHESYLNYMSIGRHEYLTEYHKKHGC